MTAHVDTLAELATVNDADFQAPGNATKIASLNAIAVAPGLMQGQNVKKVAPIYPKAAKENHIQGTVIIQAEIGEDGHVHQMTVVNAPHPLLAIAGMLAAKQWEYKPYLLNGQPIRVTTQITVIFKLG